VRNTIWKRNDLASICCSFWTSSSAVAKRSRDASCLSVVSFNSRPTVLRAQSFIISDFGFSLINQCVQLNSVLLLSVYNVDAFCHKQDSLVHVAAAFVDRWRRPVVT